MSESDYVPYDRSKGRKGVGPQHNPRENEPDYIIGADNCNKDATHVCAYCKEPGKVRKRLIEKEGISGLPSTTLYICTACMSVKKDPKKANNIM